MSTKRLTQDERASFLIGRAFRRYMERANADTPERKLVWDAYVRVVDAELTPDEHTHVMVTTGFTDASWFTLPDDPLAWDSKEGEFSDDEAPF